MNNDRKIFEEIQTFLSKPESDVAPRGLCVPFAESELHSLETAVIRDRLNEARARQHLLKQFSAEEIAHLQFVDEAVAVLNYRTLTEGVVPFPKKAAGKFAVGDRVSVEFYQGGSKKSRGTAKIDRVSDSYAWAKVDGKTVQVLQSTGQEPVAAKADYFKFVKESTDVQEAKEQRTRITGEQITESEELCEISGDLASDVHRKRQNQAFENPTPENNKLADKAHSSYIKRMVRDVYRGKTADDINKGYASDAEKNTKRGWSNESEELEELSNAALGKYKSAAGKAASAADAAGDYKTGNKRFSGIMKATKKQFANDAKAVKKESEELEEAQKYTNQQVSDAVNEFDKLYHNGTVGFGYSWTDADLIRLNQLIKITGRNKQSWVRDAKLGEMLDFVTQYLRTHNAKSGKLSTFTGQASTAKDLAHQIALHTNGEYDYRTPRTWTNGYGQKSRDPSDFVEYKDKAGFDDAMEWVQSKGKAVHFKDHSASNSVRTGYKIGKFLISAAISTAGPFSANPQTSHAISVRSAAALTSGTREVQDITDQQAAALRDIADTKNQNATESIEAMLALLKGRDELQGISDRSKKDVLKSIIDNSKKIDLRDKAKIDAIINGHSGSIKESEELEELSAKTLGSYVKKATVDVAQNSYNSGRKVHEPKEYHKSKQAAKSRIQGVMRAANKLSTRNENAEPLDRKLWAELTEQARAEFDAYPSIASAGWIAREYSAQGGEWSNEDSE